MKSGGRHAGLEVSVFEEISTWESWDMPLGSRSLLSYQLGDFEKIALYLGSLIFRLRILVAFLYTKIMEITLVTIGKNLERSLSHSMRLIHLLLAFSSRTVFKHCVMLAKLFHIFGLSCPPIYEKDFSFKQTLSKVLSKPKFCDSLSYLHSLHR